MQRYLKWYDIEQVAPELLIFFCRGGLCTPGFPPRINPTMLKVVVTNKYLIGNYLFFMCDNISLNRGQLFMITDFCPSVFLEKNSTQIPE